MRVRPDVEHRLGPMTKSVNALAAGALVGLHRDPFDRMLAAQAMIEGAALVTSDRAFDEVPVTVRW